MGKIIYWIASIFCFLSSLIVFGVFIISTSFFKLHSVGFGLLFYLVFLLSPLFLLLCGVFYVFFALEKRKTNAISTASLISLILIPIIEFIFVYIIAWKISGEVTIQTDALEGLGVAIIILFISLISFIIGTFIQFALTTIGFMIGKRN